MESNVCKTSACGVCGGEIGVMKKFISLQEVMMLFHKVKVEC